MKPHDLPTLLFGMTTAIHLLAAYFKARSRGNPAMEIVMACTFLCVTIMFATDAGRDVAGSTTENDR